MPKGAKPDHSGLVGTALDYRLRMDLPSFDFTDSKAQTGLDILKRRPNITPNGQHVHAVLEDAMAFAYLTFQELKPEPLSMGRACVVLAWCENIYRAGPRALSGAFGDLVRQTKNAQDLMLGIHEALLVDIALMHHVVSPQLDEWNQQIDEGLPFVGNPNFAGSKLVGGADADFLVGDTLVELKTSDRWSRPRLREALLQLVAYTMLDLEDEYRIRRVALLLPRKSFMEVWRLSDLVGFDINTELQTIRDKCSELLHQHSAEVLVTVREKMPRRISDSQSPTGT